MSLLESFVFLDVVQIVASDDYGSVHLGRDNHSSVNFIYCGDYKYFTIRPRIETFPVNGHFLSI